MCKTHLDLKKEILDTAKRGTVVDDDNVVYFNFDETAIQFGSVGVTYETKGAKHVFIRETKMPKTRFTLGLGVNSAGFHTTPIIIGGKNVSQQEIYELNSRFGGKVLFESNDNAWNTEDIFKRFIEVSWAKLKKDKLRRTVMVMDGFSVHKTNEVSKLLKSSFDRSEI